MENKKTILITWWTWYIWSHAVVQFEQAWYKTVIIDNLSNSTLSNLDWIENILWYKPDFHKIDLRDKEELQKIFSDYVFDWVIHFAGLKAVGESCDKPWLYFDNNISGTITLCNEMSEHNVRNLIFSSSCTVYWTPKYIPIDEKHPLWETTNPYGKTKQLLEKILEDYSKFIWFNLINLRYFNPIWNHKSWYIWENPNWIPNNLMPYIFKVLKWELEYLQVFWDDYDTIDWSWVRDYINVNDLIDWHLKAYKYIEKLDNSKKEWFSDNFNLWVWKWVSVLQMIKAVEKVSWKKVKYKIVERRDWDIAEIYGNANKAKNILLWESKTQLEESIEQMMKFWNV